MKEMLSDLQRFEARLKENKKQVPMHDVLGMGIVHAVLAIVKSARETIEDRLTDEAKAEADAAQKQAAR